MSSDLNAYLVEPQASNINVDVERYGERSEHSSIKQIPVVEAETLNDDLKQDPNFVTWDGPDDLANPTNWPSSRRWAASMLLSAYAFLPALVSSTVAPALPQMAQDLHIHDSVIEQMTLSIYILAFAIGPLFLGPLSEIHGRSVVLQSCNAWFMFWNLMCAWARTPGEMLAFRFLAGLGGSGPQTVGYGLLSDCWKAEERGKAIAIYSAAPLLGPALGPIAGGFITENTTWQWIFWSTTLGAALMGACGFFILKESYPPKLLRIKRDVLRKETANPALYTKYDLEDNKKTFAATLSTALQRPFILLFTQPIIQVMCLYQMYLYGTYYIVLSTYSRLWSDVYHESIGIGGLNYLSLGLGFAVGSQITAPLGDRIYRRLKLRNAGVGKPEFRIPLVVAGSVATPLGLFLYGWSAQEELHWIVPNIGIFVAILGEIMCFQCLTTYIVDAYTRYAASATSAVITLRCIAAFAFPLFAPLLYTSLGYGWGNSVLGFVGVGLGVPAPFLLWRFGPWLRSKSQFAAGGF